jgi:hypothetical protein
VTELDVKKLLLEKLRVYEEQAEAHRTNLHANLGAAQACRQLLAELAKLRTPEPGQPTARKESV